MCRDRIIHVHIKKRTAINVECVSMVPEIFLEYLADTPFWLARKIFLLLSFIVTS